MESDKSGKQQQEPMIIAMKGPSKKREIAFQLAEFLHYPLIDEEDIILDCKDSPSTSTSTASSSTSFEIVTKITKTQLQLKLQVIINASFTQNTHNDQLLELAMSEKARLVVIECTNEDAVIRHDKVGYARVFTINIEKQFMVAEFAPMILQDVLVDNYEKVSREDTNPSTSTLVQTIPHRISREGHAHEFVFTEKPKTQMGSSTSRSKLQYCNYCEEVVSGPTYQCAVCDEFIFHESCAEFYTNLDIILEDEGRPKFYLEPNPNPHEYEFSQMNKCRHCEGYSSNCNDCLLQTHIKCGILPTIWRYKYHEHPLSFVIMPVWCKYEYKCTACSKYGTYIGYKCYGCNVNLHVSCAIKEISEDYKKGITHIVTGPWGNRAGDGWNDGAHFAVRRLSIVYGDSIDFIEIEYIDKEKPFLSKHGNAAGHPLRNKVEMKFDYPKEYLTEVYGTYGDSGGLTMILSLTFKSNKKTYGPFGDTKRGTYFSSLYGTDGGYYKIVGFHGSSGWYLYSIGFHLEPMSHKNITPISITT